MRGEEVRAEEIIADNMAVIAQGLQNKGNLAFPSTIYKLCKDVGVPLREFRRTSRIPEESYITAKRMESTRIPRNLPQQEQEYDDEDEPMPQAGEAIRKKRSSSHNTKTSSDHSKDFPIFGQDMKANTMRISKALRSTFLACSFSSKASTKTCRNDAANPFKKRIRNNPTSASDQVVSTRVGYCSQRGKGINQYFLFKLFN
ncbi:hypothetical protein PIB30_096930 [Stylosanthes scabra]|uniref:Uncharacterized protein n=1 Tax=Stylosanthes scabra TaxID=79078 RepID=A0ABU6TVT3_9FABA|nr:hypothetical protein [Stylosanthes scabra]